MNPLVSIIVPIYRVEYYIEKCILSVLNQTYDNIEIILVDDYGGDKSIDIAKEIIKFNNFRDRSVKYIYHEKNKGLSSARNDGLKEASGEYVYFLDSDDYIINDCIEKMVSLIEQNPSIQMVMGSIMPEPKEESALLYYDLSYRNLPSAYMDNISIRKKFFDAETSIPVNGVNKLINRKFLLDNELFFKEGIIHEDEHWAFFLYRKLEYISFLFEFTYIHPVNPDSITNTSSMRNSSIYMAQIFAEWLNNMDSVQFYRQFKYCLDRFYSYYIHFYMDDSYKSLFKSFWRVAYENQNINCLYRMILFSLRTLLYRYYKSFRQLTY